MASLNAIVTISGLSEAKEIMQEIEEAASGDPWLSRYAEEIMFCDDGPLFELTGIVRSRG
jgi:hypothetical protein